MKRGGRGRGSWTAIPQLCVWRRRRRRRRGRRRRWRGWRRLVAAASAPPLPPPLSFLLPLSFPLHPSCSPSTFPNPPLSALPPYSASLTFTPFSPTSPYLIPPLFLVVSISPPTFFLLPPFFSPLHFFLLTPCSPPVMFPIHPFSINPFSPFTLLGQRIYP